MSNALTVNSVYTLLSNLEQAALKSADARVQAFGSSMSTALAAFKDAVPGLATAFVNTGINELAKAEPIFGLLVPAEVVIDPAVSGLASMLENLLLGGAVSVPVATTTQPQG